MMKNWNLLKNLILYENTFQDIRRILASKSRVFETVTMINHQSKAMELYAMGSRMAQSDRDKVPRCYEMKVKGQTSNSHYQVTESPEDAHVNSRVPRWSQYFSRHCVEENFKLPANTRSKFVKTDKCPRDKKSSIFPANAREN